MLIKVAKQLKISENLYLYMKELIQAEDIVPKPVKDRLAEILIILKHNG